MKRLNLKTSSIIIPLLMIMLVSFSGLSAFGASNTELKEGWVTLSDAGSEAGPQTDVSAIRGPGLMLDFNLPGFTFQSVIHSGKSFDAIVFPDQSSLGDAYLGYPNVPMLRHAIGIPDGAEFSVTITDIDYVEYSDINLEPMQRALLETETIADREFSFNKALYATDAYFPENWATAAPIGKFHGVSVGEIELFPVRYNPVKKSIQIAKTLSLTVEFLGERAGKEVSPVSPHLTQNLKSMLLNYDLMQYPATRSAYGNAGVDYLILAESQFMNSESLKRFADHYKSRGMNVEIKDVSTVGTTSKQIKEYITSVYKSSGSPELDYVLFVADVKAIPLDKSSGFKSDIWYAWIDGSDKIADVGLGRFPVKNEEQLRWMVDKSIQFNTNQEPGAWRNKSILVSHKEQFPGKYTGCKRQIFDNHQNNAELLKMEGGDKTQKWSNDDVIEKINEGVLIVNYRGHGSATTWLPWNQQNKEFAVKDTAKFKNGKKTPIVFSIACTNTDLTIAANSISEAFVLQEQGAVAYLGATEPSGTETNHVFDKALYDAVYTEKIQTIGLIYNHANAVIYKKNKTDKNVNLYLWLGDPALTLVPQSSNKVKLTVDIKGNGTVSPNGGSFDKNATVTLKAQPGPGSAFNGWRGDVTGSNPTVNITMNTHKNVIAEFTDNAPPPGGNIALDDLEEIGWTGGEGAWVGSWKKTGNVRKNKTQPYSGKKYARLTGPKASLERSVDLSRAQNPSIRFASRIKGFEATDKAVVKISANGTTFTDVMVFTSEHSDNTYHVYEIPLTNLPKTSKVQVVFESQMDQKKDIWFLDKIEFIDK